ncbi:hypothetical protein L1987_54261 [Smallanthus sonchifolius]|uniref:Uncharacterized protein n=1 Tax=Smallanthus sonchifolius TaxID=185202 RepID=A0ACB9E6R1_9ASTR|nr:hypothetical protein L1987_54261 [Smallanthus sonchifolius]
MDSAESKAECEDSIQTENQEGYADSAPKVVMEIVNAGENTETDSNELWQLVVNKSWFLLYRKLKKRNALAEKIDSDGNTLLHIAAVVGDKLLAELLVTENKNLLLVAENKNMLNIKDNEGHTPLDKAFENGHPNIFSYLKGATNDYEICKKASEIHEKPKKERQKAANVDETGQTSGDDDGTRSSLLPSIEIGVNLLVNAISAKRYG